MAAQRSAKKLTPLLAIPFSQDVLRAKANLFLRALNHSGKISESDISSNLSSMPLRTNNMAEMKMCLEKLKFFSECSDEFITQCGAWYKCYQNAYEQFENARRARLEYDLQNASDSEQANLKKIHYSVIEIEANSIVLNDPHFIENYPNLLERENQLKKIKDFYTFIHSLL